MTDILRNYSYPSFEGENFITDVYIFDQMDEKYVFLFHPYFSQQCAYQKDGYTFNYRHLLLKNPRGHREYHAQRIRLKKDLSYADAKKPAKSLNEKENTDEYKIYQTAD